MITTELCPIQAILPRRTLVTLPILVITPQCGNSDLTMLQIRATRDGEVRRRPRALPMLAINRTLGDDRSTALMGIMDPHMLAILPITQWDTPTAMGP